MRYTPSTERHLHQAQSRDSRSSPESIFEIPWISWWTTTFSTPAALSTIPVKDELSKLWASRRLSDVPPHLLNLRFSQSVVIPRRNPANKFHTNTLQRGSSPFYRVMVPIVFHVSSFRQFCHFSLFFRAVFLHLSLDIAAAWSLAKFFYFNFVFFV